LSRGGQGGVMNEFSARDPKTIEAELKDIYK
jgi:hypothetical protein